MPSSQLLELSIFDNHFVTKNTFIFKLNLFGCCKIMISITNYLKFDAPPAITYIHIIHWEEITDHFSQEYT